MSVTEEIGITAKQQAVTFTAIVLSSSHIKHDKLIKE